MIGESSKFASRPLLGSASRHWRSFIYAWALPLFLYVAWYFLGALGLLGAPNGAMLSALLILAPVSSFALYKAMDPVRKREVSPLQSVFWVMLVPFAFWGLLCLVPFWLLPLFKGSSGGAAG